MNLCVQCKHYRRPKFPMKAPTMGTCVHPSVVSPVDGTSGAPVFFERLAYGRCSEIGRLFETKELRRLKEATDEF